MLGYLIKKNSLQKEYGSDADDNKDFLFPIHTHILDKANGFLYEELVI